MQTTLLDHPEQLAGYRQLSDPLADDAVAALVAEQGPDEARRMFEVLTRNVEWSHESFPASLAGYWDACDRLPETTDWEQIRLANAFFLDHGPKFLVFLYYKSLPLLYTCANGAKVLGRTGRLAHDAQQIQVFTRRIAETGQFLLAVMAPGALQPGGSGIRIIQKVRLIHAAIRHFIGQNDWDAATLGVPVNQEDMALTLMTFSVALTDALEQFGLHEPPERQEAFFHAWSAIGHTLGVSPDLLPAELQQGRQLLECILNRQSAPSEDGQLLTQALLEFARKIMPADFKAAPEHLMRHLIGARRAQMLGVSAGPGCLGLGVPLFLRGLFGVGEHLEDRVQEPLHVFIDLFSRQLMHKMVGYFDSYKQQHFAVPAAFQDAWQ